MRRITSAATATLLLGALGALGAGGAQGAGHPTASSFGFFAGRPDAFLGELTSPFAACERGRQIRVVRQLDGRRTRLVGRAVSGPTGQWKLERADVPRARYYAEIPAARAGRRTCRAYRSSTLQFGG